MSELFNIYARDEIGFVVQHRETGVAAVVTRGALECCEREGAESKLRARVIEQVDDQVTKLRRPTLSLIEEKRLPDAEGWWARRRHGRAVDWFHISMVHEDDDATKTLKPTIYVSDLERHVDAAEFSSPLTRWFGPIHLPQVPT